MKPYLHSHEAVAAHGFPSLAHSLAPWSSAVLLSSHPCKWTRMCARACKPRACNRQGVIGYFIGQPSGVCRFRTRTDSARCQHDRFGADLKFRTEFSNLSSLRSTDTSSQLTLKI